MTLLDCGKEAGKRKTLFFNGKRRRGEKREEKKGTAEAFFTLLINPRGTFFPSLRWDAGLCGGGTQLVTQLLLFFV